MVMSLEGAEARTLLLSRDRIIPPVYLQEKNH